MGHRVARARCGQEHHIEVAPKDARFDVVAQPVSEHVVPVTSVGSVEHCDVEASGTQTSGEVGVVAGTREDDECCGPRLSAPAQAAAMAGGWGWRWGRDVDGGERRQTCIGPVSQLMELLKVTMHTTKVAWLVPLLDPSTRGRARRGAERMGWGLR